MKYLLIISFIFLSSDTAKVDTTKMVNVKQQNEQCLKELDIKWQEIEKLIEQKTNNNK